MILIQSVSSVWLHCAVHANLGIHYYTRLVNILCTSSVERTAFVANIFTDITYGSQTYVIGVNYNYNRVGRLYSGDGTDTPYI